MSVMDAVRRIDAYAGDIAKGDTRWQSEGMYAVPVMLLRDLRAALIAEHPGYQPGQWTCIRCEQTPIDATSSTCERCIVALVEDEDVERYSATFPCTVCNGQLATTCGGMCACCERNRRPKPEGFDPWQMVP